jgi:hypothetical protein
MSQVLGMFGLLDFTMLQPILAWAHFGTYEPFISLDLKFLQATVNHGLLKLWILNQQVWGHTCTCLTWQCIDYKLPEDDTILLKHVGV